MIETPIRVQYLHTAAKLTAGDRDKEYGDPVANLAAAEALKAAMGQHLRRPLAPGEREALEMMLTKLSRIIVGTPKPDSYIDMAAYAAIAGEAAARND